MAEILVVDDSEFDRSIIKRAFRAIGNWNAEFVTGGEEALERLQQRRFDMILTDLHMPEMNGLELLQRVQVREIDTPVVIMTSRGNEELAIKALRSGAANYIVKKMIVLELPGIIESVMHAVSSCQRGSMLLQHLNEASFRFVLPNESGLVREVIPFVQEATRKYGGLKKSELTLLGVAIEEAVSNAMIHGNLEVSSALRESDADGYQRLIEQRMKEKPYCDRTIVVSMSIASNRLICSIADEGPGFDVSSIPDPTEPEYLLRASGRGLLLMKSFMDEVCYNSKGNQITLYKNLRTPVVLSEGSVPETSSAAMSELLPDACRL